MPANPVIKRVIYRLPDLFCAFEAARIQGKYHHLLINSENVPMILDEFLLVPATDTQQRDLLELMESRCDQTSTIFCSQFTAEGWHEHLGSGALPLSEVILWQY